MFSFKSMALALALVGVVCAVPAMAGEAGHVVFVTGTVQVAGRSAVLDAAVQEGDEMQTGADGYVYVKTIDSGFLILRPNSRARIDTYHVDLQRPSETRVKLELLQGVARSISGQAVKQARQNFRFNTPVAAIGVRGTDFIVFTDQQTSRVAVVSGGVVMAGFAAGCGPEGGGPCEGIYSRELFAGQAGVLLQVERGQREPKLLHNPSLSPDQNAPPRSDEPIGKVGGLAGPAVIAVSLDAQKSGIGGAVFAVMPEQPLTPPVLVVDQKPAPPAVLVRSAPEVYWGRWQSVAGKPLDEALAGKIAANAEDLAVFVGPYAMGRLNKPTFVMPHEGMAAFVFEGGEALMQRGGKADAVATIEDARLSVNFAAQTFTTSLAVVAGADRVQVNGSGSVSSKGLMENSARSDSIVRGFLGGAHAEEAGYLFKNSSTPGVTVMGVTKWSR